MCSFLTLMTEYDVPGLRWMCSYVIFKRIKIWLCKQIFLFKTFLNILLVFRPFCLFHKECKFLEWKICNLKFSMRLREQSIFEMVDAIIHRKTSYLLLIKEIQSFFIIPSKLCLRLIVLRFSSSLRLRYS